MTRRQRGSCSITKKQVYRKVYRFRMEPTREQGESLMRMAGTRRWVWNWGLARRKEVYGATKQGLPMAQLSAELTALKRQPETAWLKEADSQLLQQALRDLDRAFVAFFEGRSRFPRFKRRKRDEPRFRIPQRVKVGDSKVYVKGVAVGDTGFAGNLPKVGWVKIRQSQPIDCPIKSATFKRDTEGPWYLTLTAEFEMPEVPLPPARPERVVGVDLGLKDFAVLSDGTRIAPPKFYRKAEGVRIAHTGGASNLERRLRRAQRELSRKQKGSKNRDKARKRLNKVHAKVRNGRQDWLHKLTTDLVQKYDGLCIEDLNLKGMAKTKLSKSVLDAALGEFRRQVEYKAVWHRKHLAVIDRYFPSSKLCRECGTIHPDLTLSQRVWTCGCGAVHDRDLNAAQNLRTEGMRHIPLVYGRSPSREGIGPRVNSRRSVPKGIVPVAVGHTATQNAWGAAVRPAHSGLVATNQESHGL